MEPDDRRVERWAGPATLMAVMLLLGGVAGYYARPVLDRAAPASDRIPAFATRATGSRTAELPSSLAEDAVSRTRHWKGDASAPVTIVEFGDFQ